VQTKKYLTTGATMCDDWSHYYYNRVIPAKSFGYFWADQDSRWTAYLQFFQNSTYYYMQDVLIGLTQTTTIRNPVLVDYVSYNCTIVSNGDTEHYGSENTPFKTPIIYLNCSSTNLAIKEGENLQTNELPSKID